MDKLFEKFWALTIISVMLLVSLGINIYFISAWQPNHKTDSKTNASSSATTNTNPNKVTIYYDDYGFTPNIVRVNIGTVITVKNTATDGPMIFNELPGEPNPYPDLNIGTIDMGQQKTFTVKRVGSWQIQNGSESADRGLIIAK